MPNLHAAARPAQKPTPTSPVPRERHLVAVNPCESCTGQHSRKVEIGAPIDQQGMLVRSGGGFVLQSDGGAIFLLELARTPVDLVAKRVRVQGRYRGSDRIEVEGIRAAD